jgi:hypothetical protein
MPIKLIEGTMQQVGKRYILEGHGYWMHGLLAFIGRYIYWDSYNRTKRMMEDNRKRFDEKMAAKASKAKSS